MTQWTVDAPTSLDLDGVVALRVRVISGSVAVLSTGDQPRVDVAALTGQPLLVKHEAGILTVTYPDLTWDGLLGWLRPQPHSANITVTVPRECPTQLGVVSASAVVSGISAPTSVKSVSGKITLDGMSGVLDARTVSGRVTADLDPGDGAKLRVATVSGEVAIRLPAQASTQVELRSIGGRVQSEFAGLAPARAPGGSTLTGTLGAGAGQLVVTSVSGLVTLLERNHQAASPSPGQPEPQEDAS